MRWRRAEGVNPSRAPPAAIQLARGQSGNASLNLHGSFAKLHPSFMRANAAAHTLPAVLETQPGEPQ
jgi:hypothetical protein